MGKGERMVYVIVAKENPERVMLVKVDNEPELRERMKLTEQERIVGCFTSADMHVLDSSRFAVVSS